MKLITKYLNSFESYLPKDSKVEIRAELESSIRQQIEDMENKLGRVLNSSEQKELLLKIGHPLRVAAAYLPDQELIGSDYYPAYKVALKLALFIFAVLTLLSMSPFVFSNGSTIGGVVHIISSIISTSIWVFVYVTLTFYLMQKFALNPDVIYSWVPEQLHFASKKIPLSRVEIVFNLGFEILFLVLWIKLFNDLDMSIFGVLIESFSLSEQWKNLYWLVIVVLILGIVLNLYNLIIAGWSKSGLILNIFLASIYIISILYVLQFDQFIVFAAQQDGDLDLYKLGNYIDFNIRIVLAFIAAVSAWEIYSSAKKLKQL